MNTQNLAAAGVLQSSAVIRAVCARLGAVNAAVSLARASTAIWRDAIRPQQQHDVIHYYPAYPLKRHQHVEGWHGRDYRYHGRGGLLTWAPLVGATAAPSLATTVACGGPGECRRQAAALPRTSAGCCWPVGVRRGLSFHIANVGDEEREQFVGEVPRDRVALKFVRSSGAGGQNVNKVNTKVDLRFKLDEADWLPGRVRENLVKQKRVTVSASGWVIIFSSAHRTQYANIEDAFAKLQDAVEHANQLPHEATEESKQRMEQMKQRGKSKRTAEKKAQSRKKEQRRPNFD